MRMLLLAAISVATLSGCDQLRSVSSGIYDEGAQSMPIPLAAVTALTCHMTQKHSASIGKGYISDGGSEKMDLTFASIDQKNGKAQLIANAGSADVPVLIRQDQMVFPEVTGGGNMNTTSVFFYRDMSGPGDGIVKIHDKRAFAVHSRHVLIMDTAVVSQWVGFCEIKTN
jgi:hypothetical protein